MMNNLGFKIYRWFFDRLMPYIYNSCIALHICILCFSNKGYGGKWISETIQHYTETQNKVKENSSYVVALYLILIEIFTEKCLTYKATVLMSMHTRYTLNKCIHFIH